MSFRTVLPAKKIDDSGLVFFEPNITALPDGSFVVQYENFTEVNAVSSWVYTPQGQLIGGGPALPFPVGAEGYGSIATLSGGGYAQAWEEDEDIFTAIYDALGNPVSTAVVASGSAATATTPYVAGLPNGGYVVAWVEDLNDVVIATFDGAGQPVGAPVNVTDLAGVNGAFGFEDKPVTALSNGNFVVTWGGGDIFSAIFDSQGHVVVAPTNVTNTTSAIEGNVHVVPLANGRYALAWAGTATSPVQTATWTAVYDAQGNVVAAPKMVGLDGLVDIALLSNGNYALTWGQSDVFTAIYNADGQLVASPLDVSNTPGQGDNAAKIAALPNGAYALSWVGEMADGSYDIFTAAYSANGGQIVAPVNVSNSPGVTDAFTRIASQPDGSWAITWSSSDNPLYDQHLAVYQYVNDVSFNTILGPTKISPGTSDTVGLPAITTLSNGSFAMTYEVIDFINFTQVVSEVFNAQGQLVQKSFAPHISQSNLNQTEPDLAALSGGGFALAWVEQLPANPTTPLRIFTAVYDDAGNQISAPVDVDLASGTASSPQVTALTSGGYVVSWLVPDQTGAGDVLVAMFNSAGQEVVAPINVSNSPGVDDAANFLTNSVTPLANGGFALTWLTKNSDFDHDVHTAIYDAQGQLVLAPRNITQSADIDENLPQVAVLANGNYALSWDGIVGAQQDRFIYTAVFDAQGNQIAAPTQVAFGDLSHVAALTNGNYALFWDDGADVFTAIYDGQGHQLVAPLHVTDLPSLGDVAHGGITALADGAYALTWEEYIADGSLDIFTAVYGPQGQQLVAPVNVSNSPGVDDTLETVDARATANGSYAITWQGPGTILPAEYLAIYQFVGSQNTGNISVIGGSDVNLDLSAIINVGGDVTISDNDNLVTLDLRNLVSVGGNFVIGNNGALLTLTLPSLVSVGGAINVNDNAVSGDIDLGSTSSGVVNVNDNAVSGSIDLGSVSSSGVVDVGGNSTGGDLDISNISAGAVDVSANTVSGSIDLGSVSSSGVVDVGGNAVSGDLDITSISAGAVDVSANAVSGSIDLGSISSSGAVNVSGNQAGGDIDIGSVSSGVVNLNDNVVAGAIQLGGTTAGDLTVSGNTVVTIDLSALVQAGAIVIANNGVVTLNLSALVNAGGDVSISGNHSLLSVDMPDLTEVGGDLVLSGNIAATVLDMSSLDSVGGDVDINGNDSATVINVAGLTTVGGDLTIDLAPDATVDASALGPGGGTVHVIGDDGRETTVILGSLAEMQGTLTITTADDVTLTSSAGLGTITLTGTTAGNTLIGSLTAKNVINGGGGADTATGGNNDDLFTAGAGDDTLDGKGGTDTAVYSGNLADYSVVRHANGSLTVTDTRLNSPDGADTLTNFELFQFADGARTLADILAAPVITSNGGSDSAQMSIAENTVSVTVVSATDPNAVGNLEFTIAGGADSGEFQIDKATGALSFTTAHDFEHPTDTGGNNVYDVIVQVSDGFHTDSQALAVSITNVNETPVLAKQTAGQSATVGKPFSLILPADTFQDPDTGDHLTLAATQSNGAALPTWLAFNPLTGAFSGTPGAGDAGSFDVKVTATDTGGLSVDDSFHFTVAAASSNHAPVITSDLGGATASVIITDDTKYVATVHASDPDPGTAITYSIVGGADQKLFAIDPKTGALAFKTLPRDGHSYDVTVAASDGKLLDTQAIKVEVAVGPFESGNKGVADTFVFKPHFGLAVVSHFDASSPAHDVIELDHALFRNADPNLSPGAVWDLVQDHSFQLGREAVIVTDTCDVIVMTNTNLHNLTAQDFALV